MFIVDAQAHVWWPETPERPWLPGGQALAHLPEALTPDLLLAEMDRVGVERIFLIPPTWEGERNDRAIESAKTHPDRFRVIGRVPLDRPEVGIPQLQELHTLPEVSGTRAVFIRDTSAYFADGTADWFFRTAAELGMNVLVYAPGMQHLVAEKAREFPELKVTVCHLGISTALRDEEIHRPIEDVLRLSELANVSVKASSLPSFVTDDYPFTSLHEPIRRVVDAFGPERVFWGSDLSRLRCDYAELKTMFLDELDFLKGEALELVMGHAICEWFDWPLPEPGPNGGVNA